MHVSDLIRAGGSLEDAAFRGNAESPGMTWARETRGDRVDPGRSLSNSPGDAGADLLLKPYEHFDHQTVPQWMEPGVD